MLGLVCNRNISWVVYHGGFDFGYILRLSSGVSLPRRIEDFCATIRIYFPKIIDIKHITKEIKELKGGLSRMSSYLGVDRIGAEHQAGSDSLLTLKLFIKLKTGHYKDEVDLSHECLIYGLDPDNQSDEEDHPWNNTAEKEDLGQ